MSSRRSSTARSRSSIPAFVSTLCICIVFVPMFLLAGVAGYLFVPMAEAVVFAMLGSYVLSRTLVPTMANYLLRAHAPDRLRTRPQPPTRNPLVRFQAASSSASSGSRSAITSCRTGAGSRGVFVVGFPGASRCSRSVLAPCWAGFFSGGGRRPDQAACARPDRHADRGNRALCAIRSKQPIRAVIPPAEIDSIVDNIGLPISGINLAYSNTGNDRAGGCRYLISLKAAIARPPTMSGALRDSCRRRFPARPSPSCPPTSSARSSISALPAPIDVQIVGQIWRPTAPMPTKLLARDPPRSRASPTRASSRPSIIPQFDVDVDRTRAASSASPSTTSPTICWFRSPAASRPRRRSGSTRQNGVSYPIVMQTPQYRLDSLATCETCRSRQPALRSAIAGRRWRRFIARPERRGRIALQRRSR